MIKVKLYYRAGLCRSQDFFEMPTALYFIGRQMDRDINANSLMCIILEDADLRITFINDGGEWH